MKRNLKTLILPLAAAFALALPVTHCDAASTTYRFTGTVTDSDLYRPFTIDLGVAPGLEVKIGDAVTGTVEIRSNPSAFPPDLYGPRTGTYLSFNGLSLMINGTELSDGKAPTWAIVANNVTGDMPGLLEGSQLATSGDAYVLVVSSQDTRGVLVDGQSLPVADYVDIKLNLTDSTGTVFQNTGHPTQLDLEKFDIRKGFITPRSWWGGSAEQNPDTNRGILFSIDTLEIVGTDDAEDPNVVIKPATPVLITAGPDSRTVSAGDDLILTVQTQGTEPLSIQWSSNGVDLRGETMPGLAIPNVQPGDSGTYRVRVWSQTATNTALARIQIDSPDPLLKPLELTGWNTDLIVEAGGDFASHVSFDGGGSGKWIGAGFDGHPDGFPSSRTFTSVSSPEVQYALQPYDGNNGLWLTVPFINPLPDQPTGTLTLVRPAAYKALAIAASSANGGGTGQVVLRFSDGTSRTFDFTAADWWTTPSRTEALAIAGLGRYFGALGSESYSTSSGYGFGLYETRIDLAALGLDAKLITQLDFTKPTSTPSTAIFAVSGMASAPASVALTIRRGFVSWLGERGRYILEEAPQPTGPWVPHQGNAPISAGGRNAILINMQSGSKFYRLTKAPVNPDISTEGHHIFTDTKTGYQTTAIHDVNGDIVRVNTFENSLIWDASGMSYSKGMFPVSDGIFLGSNRFFQVRFGTEGGQRKAFFTETAAGTICDIRFNGTGLQIFATSVRVPNP